MLLPTTATLKAATSTLLLFLLTLTPSLAQAAKKPPAKNAILLSKVKTLTFRGSNAQTAHRRVSPIPQLKCISHPKICALYEPDVLQCTNQGSSYGSEDIEWSCTASLPPELKLGSTDVICEGYSGPEDDYILKGSCGVEYRLILTELGEEKFPDLVNAGNDGWWKGGSSSGGWGTDNNDQDPSHARDPSPAIKTVFWIIFIIVLGFIILGALGWLPNDDNNNNNGRRLGGPNNGGGFWGGGGGGGGGGGFDPGFGGGDDDHDPPPPYSKYRSQQNQSQQNQQGWRPGFWTGLGTGAAAGYVANRAANRGNNTYRDTRPVAQSTGWGSSSSGGAGPSGSRSSGSRSGSVSSSTRATTGFGSTSRR